MLSGVEEVGSREAHGAVVSRVPGLVSYWRQLSKDSGSCSVGQI